MPITLDGTNGITLPDGSKGEPILATAVTMSSFVAVDFSSIPSWARRITVIFSEVSNNAGSAVLVRVGSGTFATTGYVSTSNDMNQTSVTGGSNNTTGFLTVVGASAASILTGQLVIQWISGTTYTASGVFKYSTTNMALSAGSISLGGSLDRLRITTVSGTDLFDGGTANIMWE